MSEEKFWKWIINKNLVILVITISILIMFGTWYVNKDYDSRTGVVTDWNYIQLGFNIFFEEGDTLFLHGGDWMLQDFLELHEYPKTMTFKYHKETTGCGTACGCRTWNHIMEIYDESGTKIFERELWQEWQ